ncbi:MAG: type II toxin-antitoxin system HicB family antitoxin [Thermodesulfobacteriota bacterium]
MKTVVLKVSLTQEADGRWSAVVTDLPGCSSWGYSQQEALDNIKDAAEIYLEDMVDSGKGFPSPSDRIKILDEPAIAVSL